MIARCLCTATRRCQPTTLSAALDHTARRSRRSLEEIATALGRSAAYLAKSTNPDCRERLAAIDLPAFMRAAESIMPLRVLAAELNCVVVQLPDAAVAVDDVFQRFTAMVSEVGEDSEAIRIALKDRVVTPEEGQAIAREIDDTIEAALAVKAAVLARVTAKPSMVRMALEQPMSARRLRA